jgi:hypothetical protein
MPIRDSEFGKGRRDPSLLLLGFLSFNFRNAYTLDELVEAMKSLGRNLSKEDVEGLLSALEYGGRAKSKVIDGVTYYMYSRVAGLKLI